MYPQIMETAILQYSYGIIYINIHSAMMIPSKLSFGSCTGVLPAAKLTSAPLIEEGHRHCEEIEFYFELL